MTKTILLSFSTHNVQGRVQRLMSEHRPRYWSHLSRTRWNCWVNAKTCSLLYRVTADLVEVSYNNHSKKTTMSGLSGDKRISTII